MPLLVKSPATIATGIHVAESTSRGGLEGSVAVAQEYVDGICRQRSRSGDGEIGAAVVEEIAGRPAT